MRPFQTILAGAALALAPLAATAGDAVGLIKHASGDVKVMRDGVSLTNVTGAPVYATDRLVTGADGAVGITLNDDSMLSLGPNSKMDISHFAYGTGNDAMEATLHKGTLAAVSGKITQARPEAMKVRTPTTILGVRGTQFLVEVAAAD